MTGPDGREMSDRREEALVLRSMAEKIRAGPGGDAQAPAAARVGQ